MLNFNQMPESFIGQTLQYIAHNHWLNPPTEIPRLQNIPKVLKIVDHFTRYLCRTFCVATAGAIGAPLGVIYNGAFSLRYRVFAWKANHRSERERRTAMAWEYFKASCTDLRGLSCIIIAPIYGLPRILEKNIDVWFSSSEVFINKDSQTYQDAKLKFYTNQIVRKTSNPQNWGSKAYKVKGCQAYSYCQLKQFATDLRTLTGIKVSLNNKELLRGVRFEIWNAPIYDPPLFSLIPENYNSLNLNNLEETPQYRTSWKSVGLIVMAIAIGFFTLSSLYADYINGELPDSITSILKNNYFLASVPFAFLALAKEYDKQHRDIEKELADGLFKAGKIDESLYWYAKAAMGGYAPAQRIYGLFLLKSLPDNEDISTLNEEEIEEIDRGLNWLYSATINGEADAEEDLSLLIGNHRWNRLEYNCFFRTKRERIKDLFRETQFLKIARNRFNTIHNG